MAETATVVDLPTSYHRDPHRPRRALPGLFSLADGKKYASQVIDLIEDACSLILIAGEIRRACNRVNGVTLVALPKLYETDPMFDLVSPLKRDLLIEAVDRLVKSGRIERESGMGYRWGKTRRQALYVDPNGRRVPLDIWWVDERSLGLQYALATGPVYLSEAIMGLVQHTHTLPRTFKYKDGYLVWTINGEVMPVPDETALERCLGRKLPEPHRRR